MKMYSIAVIVCMTSLQLTSGWFFPCTLIQIIQVVCCTHRNKQVGHQTNTPECDLVSEYIELRSEISSKPCISTTQAYIDSLKDPAGHCQCTGDFQKNIWHHVGYGHDNIIDCVVNPDCLNLFDNYYLHVGHHNERSDCKTHHHVWSHLRGMHIRHVDLQTDLVLHLSSTFSKGLEDTCKCTEIAPLELSTTSTASPQVSASKTPLLKMTSLTTTDLPASATSLKYQMTTATGVTACDKFAVLIALAKDSQVVNQNAAECLTGSHSSHDALVLSQCNVSSSPSSWKQGINVMSDCIGAESLHAYTPVAMFENGMYPSKGSISGIFLHCTTTGFTFVSQSCDESPHVIEVALNGTNNYDPNMFYTIS